MSNIQKIQSTRPSLKKDNEKIEIASKDIELGFTLEESIIKASYNAARKRRGHGEEINTIFSPSKMETIKDEYRARKKQVSNYKQAILLENENFSPSTLPKKIDTKLILAEEAHGTEFFKFDEPKEIQNSENFVSRVIPEEEQHDKHRKTQFHQRANLIRRIASHYSVDAERIGYTQHALEDGSISEQYFITQMHDGLSEYNDFSSRKTKENKFTDKIEANKFDTAKVR